MKLFQSKFFIIICAIVLFLAGFSLYSVTLTDGSAVGNMGKEITVFFKNGINSVGRFFLQTALKDFLTTATW